MNKTDKLLIVRVTKTGLSLDNIAKVNSGEINVTECYFIFDEAYTETQNVAVFTKDSQSFEVNINGNHCLIPYDVLKTSGLLEIGVYGYQEQDGRTILRYSPTPTKIYVEKGSFPEDITPPEPVTERYLKKENIKGGKGINVEYYNNDVIINSSVEEIKNYDYIENKPKLNGVEIVGDKSSNDFGITSLSDNQIYGMLNNKADKYDTYTKQEVNELVNFDLNDYYNKSEVDTLISNINPDLSDYYTKAETNNLITEEDAIVNQKLLLKANVSDVYTKAEIDQKIKPEVELKGWTSQTVGTFEELDLTNFIEAGITRFTILFYMRKSSSRKCIKFELTINELDKYIKKIQTNEAYITRIAQGFSSVSSIGMLVQTIKGIRDETTNELLLNKLMIKYNFYENGSEVTAFDNFEFSMYGS